MDKEETKLYGECAYLLNKIFDKTETMEDGWDELINMLASIDDTQFKTEQELYNKLYKFARNVYWRIRTWKEPQKFDQFRIAKSIAVVIDNKVKYEDGFTIWNYSYKIFLWALDKGYVPYMSTQMIQIPRSMLSEAEIKRFESKCQNEKQLS